MKLKAPEIPLEDIDRAWRYYEHADNLLHTRHSVNVGAQSFLLVAASLAKDRDSENMFILLAILGSAYAVLWYLNTARLLEPLKILKEDYLKNDEVYKSYLGKTWGGSTSMLRRMFLGSVVNVIAHPLIALTIWFFLLWFEDGAYVKEHYVLYYVFLVFNFVFIGIILIHIIKKYIEFND